MKTSIIKFPLLYIALSFCVLLFTEGECNPDVTPSFKVAFDTDGGSAVAAQDIVQGAKATKPTADPTREGYTFLGWYKADKTTAFNFATETISAAATIYAKWEAEVVSFAVSFNTDGGSDVASQSVESGAKAAKPPTDPTKDGYTFLGWYKADKSTEFDFTAETITAATTIYAKWEALSDEASILSFSFEQAKNEGLLDVSNADISGTIDESAKTISFIDVSPYVQLDKLKASFTVSAGASVNIGGENQSTGETVNDFSSDITYEVVAADGVTKQRYVVTITKSNLATIPDATFLAKLKLQFPAAFTNDLLDITHSDVMGFTGAIDVEISSIASLKGIEFFTGVTDLRCPNNQLKSLDVSKNAALAQLDCNNNELKSLDVSKNTALKELYCNNTKLSSLDVSTNTALTNLSCSSNELKSLDVSTNTVLKELYCNSNELSSLDVSKNAALKELYCYNNPLKSLDVSTNAALTNLSCSSNELKSLDVSKNIALTALYCDNNELKSLDVSKNTDLKTLGCFSNELKSLDVNKNTSLFILECGGNQLASLDIRGMRSGVFSIMNASPAERTNALTSLKVHDDLKDHSRVKAAKAAFGSSLSISTYSAAAGSTTYTLICSDYNPNEAEGSRCKE